MTQSPRTLDGYTLICELGRGGMGVVYQVKDPRLDRTLAMKVVLGSEADPETLLRFEREAELLARIDHPNVVRIHGTGNSESGPYFVAERVEGTPLDRVLARQGAFAPAVAAALVRDLASAVSALHAEGVIHRDLKPGNVILRPDGTPVLIDFGLARDPGSERLTMTGTLLGTPNYMSPEQALAQSAEVGPASDVYALGGVLFALLTGSAPFAGRSQLEVLDAITRLDPTWPPDARAQVPAGLQGICRSAMNRDPAGRPTARELQMLLQAPLRAGGGRSARALFLGAFLTLTLVGLGAAAIFAFGPAEDAGLLIPDSKAPSPPPTQSPPSLVAPTPPNLTTEVVTRGLRRNPTPELFERAQEILAGSGPGENKKLRSRYIRARLRGPPLRRRSDLELPPAGLVEWVDDTRLILASRVVDALYRWPDWRLPAFEKIDHRGKIFYSARPLVFGELALKGGQDTSGWAARSYDWTSREPLRTYAAETPVTSLALGEASGRAILAVGTRGRLTNEEGTILVYDLETGQLLRTLRGHARGIRGSLTQTEPEVSSLEFSPDGRWLVSGGFAGDLCVWDVADGSLKEVRRSDWGDVRDLALHPTQPLLAVSAGFQKVVRILKLPSLEDALEFKHIRGKPSSLTFSRDGRFLFAGSRQRGRDTRIGELSAYDLSADEVLYVRPYGQQALHSLALSPSGCRLAIYSETPERSGVFEVYEVDVPPREE